MAAGQRASRRWSASPGIGLTPVATVDLPAHVDIPWSGEDERNWVANRRVLRELKKRGEEPSEWLASECRDLDARRKAKTPEERRAAQDEIHRAHIDKTVAKMASQLTPERCREIISILTSK